MRHVVAAGLNLNALWVRLASRALDALVLNMHESGEGVARVGSGSHWMNHALHQTKCTLGASGPGQALTGCISRWCQGQT